LFGIKEFAEDIPKLHNWGGEWNAGGFWSGALQKLFTLTKEQASDGARVIETGAGASTIAFLLAGARQVTTVAHEPDLFDRIMSFCDDKGVPTGVLQCEIGRSEIRLPQLAAKMEAAGDTVDLALIDGGHGWPTVFVDFCYMNAMLRRDGLMIVDDVQLHSVKELARLLSDHPHFELVGQLASEKTLIFRKLVDHRFLNDFGSQPYIMARTRSDAEAGRKTSLDW